MRLGIDTPASALAISAHPDDAEFGCGATLARWSAAGCAVHLLVLTDGSKGSWDPAADTDALVRVRQDEQRAALAALGGTGEARFLSRVDGELESTASERRDVAEIIRELRPEVVLGHDPWKRYRLHPDHRAAGWITCDAVVAARDPHFFPGVGPGPWRPHTVLLFEADEPDVAVDVTGHVDAKLAALESHVSQFVSTMAIADADDGTSRERFRRRVRDELATHGRAVGVAYAEVFKAIDAG